MCVLHIYVAFEPWYRTKWKVMENPKLIQERGERQRRRQRHTHKNVHKHGQHAHAHIYTANENTGECHNIRVCTNCQNAVYWN